MTTPNPIDVDNIVTCATNEGGLYPKWCAMARDAANTPDSAWARELRAYVLTLIGRYYGSTSPATINAAAAALRDYYLRHIQEL